MSLIDAEVIDEPIVALKEETERPPSMTDPEWVDYIMSFFEDKELDSGLPKLNGLIRLTRKFIGPILKVIPNTKQVPTIENEGRATVEIIVTILNKYNLEKGEKPYVVEYGDVADCYLGNTKGGPEYARFPAAMASTRALVRALRRALSLDVVASEEISDVPAEEAAMNGPIKESQITKIDILCGRSNIDVIKFINLRHSLGLGKKKYNMIEDVDFVSGTKMFTLLNEYQRKVKPIPEEILGYKPNWRGDIE